jgi:hypothetical protein
MSAGIEVVTLKKKVSEISDGMKVGGMFLKRCLTDLRTIWSLLQTGYTSQAGCIAAAAFENALNVEAISNNDERARLIMNNESGDAPWSVVNLCKFHADQAREEVEIAQIIGHGRPGIFFEKNRKMAFTNASSLIKNGEHELQHVMLIHIRERFVNGIGRRFLFLSHVGFINKNKQYSLQDQSFSEMLRGFFLIGMGADLGRADELVQHVFNFHFADSTERAIQRPSAVLREHAVGDHGIHGFFRFGNMDEEGVVSGRAGKPLR